jgi:DNA primase
MSLYIDVKYLNQIGTKLPLFKRKNQYLYNCRCPVCGDSQTKKNKARGFFYRQQNDLYYKCHNCGVSMHFGSFLKDFDGNLYREYRLERYSNGENRRAHANPEKDLKAAFDFTAAEDYFPARTLLDELLDRVDTLPADHEVRQFCMQRLIPDHQLSRLYFIDDMRKIGQISPKMREKIVTAEPRLVIPFKDGAGRLLGLTCRALRGEDLRYIMVRIDEDAPQIFGLDEANPLTTVYVVEGPLDSLFLQNAIAVGGTGFGKLDQLKVEKRRLTVVIDNQPRNREVVAVYKKVIDAGYNVFIWPDTAAKDINDLVLETGKTARELGELIDARTFGGLRATMEFNNWKKV